MKKNILVLISVALGLGSCAQQKTSLDLTTVKNFEINRYLGKWYEIARFDHRFEKIMVVTTAVYSLNVDNTIRVENSGYQDSFSGKFKTAIGKGKFANKDNPAMLKVAFFLWFYGAYNVLELDKENYSYSMIGSNSDKYFWILSRTPQLKDKDKAFLLNRAEERGFDTSKIIWVEQR